ncbi:glycosyl hydrolase 115 family protein [Jiulongibacter sediminis]|uniref:Glycosyl hydrolase n=1 Tax=Jiulongibacter sediminis TaxID=1605367 RepID=A0A0P7BVB7_9BACT|nr:glycosyl hydrolase 115 family protein [Jiulongibacter sediminis]KPM48618.1 glycosyl hydrolase [Jiulongibacter sediminis]TBX25156.1 glycosyl hydrolase [Jiulongibacter sediminis]
MKKIKLLCLFLMALPSHNIFAIDDIKYVTETKGKGDFTIIENNIPAAIFLSQSDFGGVLKAAENLKKDLSAISGNSPTLTSTNTNGRIPNIQRAIIIGTLGHSDLIKELVNKGKIKASDLEGKWETFKIITVKNPFRGIKEGLVIVGSDKRGTIFGIYDLSRQMGISPWYWWADVPIAQKTNLFVKAGTHTQGTPKVKYRGIFINDEAPALSGWVQENYGGVFNHEFYEKVFELILRQKANYLWPAMWGRAFFDDDPLNAPLADEMGVVIGTTHHEPLHRAHVEWDRYGKGEWNYEHNPEVLRDFWRKSMKERHKYESIVSIGMRGDGDEPMSRETATALLEQIVEDQRKIIEETTGKPANKTAQLWALYKEVQDYYDKGMRVPEDVTLLLCDDNWGNIRKLPNLGEKPRKGGYGIYYHFDYVGGPRNYKWINTNPLPRIWEQMHLAHEYGANEIWIVNVGDIKPMEIPTSFFLDYAWDPDRWNQDQLDEYLVSLSSEMFGEQHSAEIADILAKYAKYNARRKPELLEPGTFSLTQYREADRVQNEWKDLLNRADDLKSKIDPMYADAFYQLVYHPVEASQNLNALYHAAAKNEAYYQQERSATNDMAFKVQRLFDKDQQISDYYNHTLAKGKWNHFMDQTHIGYTYWQQPRINNIPAVRLRTNPKESLPKVSIEGNFRTYTAGTADTLRIELGEDAFFEVYNQGDVAFSLNVEENSQMGVQRFSGQIKREEKFWVKPSEAGIGTVKLKIDNNQLLIPVKVIEPSVPENFEGFVESKGVVSMFAENYSKAVSNDNVHWQFLPDIGRERGGITSFPVTEPPNVIEENSPRLEYAFWITNPGEKEIHVQMAPTVAFNASVGLSIAVSVDGEKPEIININGGENNRAWEQTVADNLREVVVKRDLSEGAHTLKIWRADPGVVFRKLVIQRPANRFFRFSQSYLGPPESPRVGKNSNGAK